MRWRMCRRSRTICLSLAFATIFLHLLLALFSLSSFQQTCDTPLPPGTHILRELARTNYSSAGVRGRAVPPTEAKRRDSSTVDAKGHARVASDLVVMATNVGGGGASRAESLDSGLSKLAALFDHPLYSQPSAPIPEEDWLLKVKPKIKSSEKSSQRWVSASREGYEDVQWNSSSNSHPPWLRFHLGISRWQLYPHRDPNMEALTQQLATHRIVSAVQKSGGTQLKLVMSFPNYGQAMVKPMKQERDDETNYNLYYFSDFERHNAEIAAFHLDRILGYRRIPPVVGRLVDVVKEIKDITTDRKLARTFFTSPVGNMCFYGQCSYYCSTEHAVCGRPRNLEASVAVMLPDLSLVTRRTWRSPWRRSYSRSKLAKWETEPDYCTTVKATAPYNKGTRLVDFIDMVILDFLMRKLKPISITTSKNKKRKRIKDGKVPRHRTFPRTGTEVVQFFTQKNHLAEVKLYYLIEVGGCSYRPYDLQVVPSTEAGSEHYIFSPNYVLHVTEKGFGGLVSLVEWYRESVLWTTLHKIPFFQFFRLRKAFNWWYKNVRRVCFLRRCKALQNMLLMAVPQFRSALQLFIRVIEDMKETHLLPLEESKTYTLPEFQNALRTKRQEFLNVLEKLSQYRTVILNVVKENRYKAHLELQLHLEYANKPNKRYEPIHLHLDHQHMLNKELSQSEGNLKKLGNFAYLINQMILQSLITVIRDDVHCFLNNILKRTKPQQLSLFNNELCFSDSCQLTVHQPIVEFQDAVSEALITVSDTIIQMCDTSGFFLEIRKIMPHPDFALELPADLSEHPGTAEKSDDSGRMAGRRKFCCWQLLKKMSDHWLLLQKQASIMGQGNMVHGCYYPLSKAQLEWQISINHTTEHVEKQLAEDMQEAGLQNKHLLERFSWLVEIYLFISQWNSAFVESMKGQPASLYEEHIRRVCQWTERINSMPSSVSTSNQLFSTKCKNIKNTLVQRLRAIEKELLKHLVEQIALYSENLISDLETASADLKMEPEHDLHDFSTYALMVRELVKMLPDMQKRLDYIHSLQNTMHDNYRKLTKQELKLEEKMLGLWDEFIPLLKKANNNVSLRLPSMANALDSMFSFLVCDLKIIASKAECGPFVDPSQNAIEMLTKLNYICTEAHQLNVKLEQLNGNSQKLHEHNIDMDILNMEIQRVKARKELWELIASYTTWMDEWKQMLFIEVVVSEAQGNVSKWKEKAVSLQSIIPTKDPVLQETLGKLKGLSHHLAIIDKLKSPLLQHRHWKAFFEGMGLLYVPGKLTAAELMYHPLEVQDKLITKICMDAQAECSMEQTFLKLCQKWEHKLFSLDAFTLPVWQHFAPQHEIADRRKQAEGFVSNLQSASQQFCNKDRIIIIGLEIYCAEIESDRMTVCAMLKSPYSVEFRLQMENWIQTSQELERLLDLLIRYQQMWTFLMRIFNETFFSVQRVDLLEQFRTVDETFEEIMNSISTNRHVLNLAKKSNNKFHGNSLCQILIDGLCTMEIISNQVVDLLDVLCEQFPRLWFLSDKEVIELLSLPPSPFALEPFVSKCFKGIMWLDVGGKSKSKISDARRCETTSKSNIQMKVLGIYSSFQEHITFQSPLEENLNTLDWLRVLEKQLKSTMVRLMKQCAAVRNQLESSSQYLTCKVGGFLCHISDKSKKTQTVLDLVSEYPLQCLLVAEEALWCSVVVRAFHESGHVAVSSLRAYNSAKLKRFVHFIREGIAGTNYMRKCLGALVQLTMNHAQQLAQLLDVQGVLESSFEWISFMKYHIKSQNSYDDTVCFVDVLGHHFQYGFEYFGPEDWVVHTPSTDRTILGILLALKSYRCGFVRGPCMSGKNKTVGQLGKALGQQVVTVQCCPDMKPGILQKRLLGALSTGALLLLDSVDLLTERVQSFLAQHLTDIHQYFSDLTNNNQRQYDEPKSKAVDPEFQIAFAGKRFSPNLNYGCVLISPLRETSGILQSLLFATRPISLTQPDYRIIAEVMLTSVGFSEAMSLSHRLVSLLSLARDSLCLPHVISDQCSYLVVLQKIISASEIHLLQNVRDRKISDKVGGLAAEKKPDKNERLERAHLSVIQTLLEETAIVKAIITVFLPFFSENRKASKFDILFKDVFPIACQYPYLQEGIQQQENQLRDAVTEELQRIQYQLHPEIISNTLTLYQAMKSSQTVLLLGPSGCGKTTTYCVLAGALNSLAANTVKGIIENEDTIKENLPQAGPNILSTSWPLVDIMVFFPNAMSHEEVFGSLCEKRGWQDGALTRMLRDTRRHKDSPELFDNEKKTPLVKWVIMDGEPMGHPGWLDYLTTLCKPEESYLFLPSGETVVPSRFHIKLFIEVTDLSMANPSVVTHCSLVHVRATDLWKAVWNMEMDALYCEYKLNQGILKMWNCLSQDLFSSTLSYFRKEALNSAMHNKEESHLCGLQEIMSFVRILRALLHHFGTTLGKAEAVPQTHTPDTCLHGTDTPSTDSQIEQKLFGRDLFLVAYIWGFGGHLHSRHWPQFDLLVRQVLLNCRYKIVLPDKESVFEYFISTNSKICLKNTLVATSITPKHEKYAYLLNLMLEANQPVLLAGEPGSGKTTLCQTLLSFDKPHISLPASPLLRSKDLRDILTNLGSQTYLDALKKRPRLILFIDDLHEAPCDVFGRTSMALELLRGSMSKIQVLTLDNYFFKFLTSGSLDFIVTCCLSGFGSHQNMSISSRLSRLFSIFVLPCLSMDILLSIYSPRLQVWLKYLPLKQSAEDLACCIVTATNNIYHAVSEQFQPTWQRPHFIFSKRDLHKVFQGMYLWQPNIPTWGAIPKNACAPSEYEASVVNIVNLWMHECLRTFSDRLCSEDESKTFTSLIVKAATTHFQIRLVDETQFDIIEIPHMVTNPAIHMESKETSSTTKQTGHSPDNIRLQEPKLPQESELSKDIHCALTEAFTQLEESNSHVSILKTLPAMKDIFSQLVYGPKVSKPLNVLNLQQIFNLCSSYEKLDLEDLLHKLSAILDYKEDSGPDCEKKCHVGFRYFVNRQRVGQLLHVLRALLIPGGHGVLLSSDRCTGRKSTVRLAAYLTGYHIMEIHSGNENKLHEILKEAGNHTRVNGNNVIILVHEEISQSAREELLVAMAHRSYPALYTKEEIRNLVSRVSAVNSSRKYLMDSWTFEKCLRQVHKNVHVFLLMPLIISESERADNDGTTWNGQMTKSLSVSCCVEVYQPWSNQSLVEIATQFFKTSLYKREQKVSLSVAMAGIHQSASQYASVLLRAQPFSLQTYTEFNAHFDFLCNHLHKQWHSQANRIKSVLTHLDVMNTTAENYKQHLICLQEKVDEIQQHEQKLIKAVDDQECLTKEAEKRCVEEENKLCHVEDQISQAQIEEQPIFHTGIKILEFLNPSDIEEVRHYRDPPDGVVKIMDAICLLFNRPPGWESTKQLLGQPNFFQELEFFDRTSVKTEQLQQLRQIVHSPHFSPESVREVSKACESLCRWVQALYQWCSMQNQLSVKQQLEVLAREVRGQLRLSRQHKENACHRLNDFKLQLRLIRKELEQQLLEVQKFEDINREATAIVGQLRIHERHWKAAAKDADLQFQNLAGDALILAAVIAYLGPFAPAIRTELLSKWAELCQKGCININPRDPRTSLFTDPVPPYPTPGFPISVSVRLQQPLGQALGLNDWQLQDIAPGRLLVQLLLWGYKSVWKQHWPLLADTKQHDEVGIQSWFTTETNGKLETQFEIVVSADDAELLDKLNQATDKGLKVLITRVEHAIPTPHFLSLLVRSAESQGKTPHPGFCLFLSTHLPVRLLNNEIHSSILNQVHVVDLSLSSEEIYEHMLTKLLESDCKKLLMHRFRLQSEKHLLQNKLFKEQEAFVDFILRSNTLLRDSDFHTCIVIHQESLKKLQTNIQLLKDELDYYKSLMAAPNKLARMAASFYQCLQSVSRLSPAYYFSLQSFIRFMQEASIVKGRPLVSCTFGKILGDIVPEITNRMAAKLLAHYRPCLFKPHLAVLRLLVSVELLQLNDLCSESEKAAFLRGLQDIEHCVSNVKSTSSLPNWIPAHIHPELLSLEKDASFRGLITSLSTSPLQWQEYLHLHPSSVTGRVPCRSHSHLSLLQRALLWKTLVPNCLEALAETIAACSLCWLEQTENRFPHTGDPEFLSRYILEHEGPIILALPSPRRETRGNIEPLDLINKMALCVQQTNKVQVKVVSLEAACEGEVILLALDKAVNNGNWLVFNDCHLPKEWNNKVVAQIHWLISSLKDQPHLVHPCFRLWFITNEHAPQPIPAAFRICALPLVCDSPLDLKEELNCSLRELASIIRQSPLDVKETNLRPLFCCATFHSVLSQRQIYNYSGQGRLYNWNQEDLRALVHAYKGIASVCHNKTKALQYLAVNLVHGSHIQDFADIEEMESVAKTFLTKLPPLSGSGAKSLSNIIVNPGHFDLLGLLGFFGRSHRDSANISDPLMLGFGKDVAAELKKLSSHNLNILLRASQSPLGILRRSNPQPVKPGVLPTYSHARDRLQALKGFLTTANLASTVTRTGAVSHSPLRDFLQDEWDELIDWVSLLLSQLQQPVQYRTLTFASLLKLCDLSRFERRAELLSAYLWHHNISDPPGAYRLSAFKNGRGFLVAVIREAAQVNYKYMSDIELLFQVVSDSTCPASLPSDAVYLCGLELKGASWDAQLRALQDTDFLQPCLMPLVCVKAQVRKRDVAKDTFAYRRSDLSDIRNVKASPSTDNLLPVFYCPLFLNEEWETIDWGLADDKMITKIPLHAGLKPELCSLRRVRLVSTL